jgi:transposase
VAGDRVEVITRVERRRRWAMAEKLRLVAATRQSGATVASVAREHGVSEGLLYTWRSRFGHGPAEAGFAPLTVLDAPRPAPTAGAVEVELPAETIEIALPNGCRLRVHERIPASTLRKVVGVLGGLRPGC